MAIDWEHFGRTNRTPLTSEFLEWYLENGQDDDTDDIVVDMEVWGFIESIDFDWTGC